MVSKEILVIFSVNNSVASNELQLLQMQLQLISINLLDELNWWAGRENGIKRFTLGEFY